MQAIETPTTAHLMACLDFIKRTCAESGRPDEHSHGWRHMKAVCAVALELADASVDRTLLASVCLLHDVADPKYDKDGRLKVAVVEFLQRLHGVQMGLHAWEIIKCASYSQEWALRANDLLKRLSPSTEVDPIPDGTSARSQYMQMLKKKLHHHGITEEMVRNHRVDWAQTMCRKCGGNHAIYRQLLSEADKLEAMGEAGVYRCMRYGLEYAEQHKDIEPNAHFLIGHVVNHYAEKLGILYPHYFETKAGQERAKELHAEQERVIAELRAVLLKITEDPAKGPVFLPVLHEDMKKFA